MYELISIPKRNTTAAGVTHFMCKFLVLISKRPPGPGDDCHFARRLSGGPSWNLESDLMIFMNRAPAGPA
jgi:hypothetical protein